MVIKLTSNEENLSGKEFTNIFKEARIVKSDLAAFERINILINEGKEPAKALGVEWDNLSKSNQEMSRQLVKSNKPLDEVKQGFLTASQSASKLTLASKAATLGMKALSVAMKKHCPYSTRLVKYGECFCTLIFCFERGLVNLIVG